jgi:putative oxidoreductase
LILRVVFGVALMLHGWSKIQKPFGWMGGRDVPGFLQALAAVAEFGGGLALVLGLLTPLAAVMVIGNMIGAWYFAHRSDPWINPGGKSFELASLYGVVALSLLFTGPGLYALDALIFGKGKRK